MQLLNIFKKEWKLYWTSPIVYIFLVLFMGLSSYLFFIQFFVTNQSTMREFFALTPWLLLFFIPALTMRVWSEEKKSGTIETLLSFPLKESDIMYGKLLSTIAVSGLAVLPGILIALCLGPIPHVAGILIADFDWGRIISGYIGLLALISCLSILGQTVSLTTKNQIVAFLVTICVGIVLYLIGQTWFIYSMPEFMQGFVQSLSLSFHYGNIANGLIPLRDVVYFASFFYFFLVIHQFLIKDR